MLPAVEVPRLFISDVKFKDVEILMSILRSGKAEIDDEDYEGLKNAARVMKIKLTGTKFDEEEENRNLVIGAIIVSSTVHTVQEPRGEAKREKDGKIAIPRKVPVKRQAVEPQDSVPKLPGPSKRKSNDSKSEHADDDGKKIKIKFQLQIKFNFTDEVSPSKKAKISPRPSMSSQVDVKNKTTVRCPFCDKTYLRMPKNHIEECVGNPNRTVDRCTRNGRKGSESSVSSI